MFARLSLLALGGLMSLIFLLTPVVSAVEVFDVPCTEKPDATVCKEKTAQQTNDSNPLFGPDGVLTFVINLLSVIIGIAAIIIIIIAALKLMTGGSNPQDANSAREMVIYAVIGLIIVASAQLLVRLFLGKIGA